MFFLTIFKNVLRVNFVQNTILIKCLLSPIMYLLDVETNNFNFFDSNFGYRKEYFLSDLE